MKLKLIALTLSLGIVLLLAGPALAQGPLEGDQFIFGKDFILPTEQVVDGNVVVLGGNLTAKTASKINGDVAVFGGDVTIDGTVDGDIAVFGGNISLSNTAVVNGEIALIGGQAHIDDKAQLHGLVRTPFDSDYRSRQTDADDNNNSAPSSPEPPDKPDFAPLPPFPPADLHSNPSLFEGIANLVNQIFWAISLLVILSLITWLVAAFMPEQMLMVRRVVSESPVLSLGIGLVTALVAGFVGFILLLTICLAFIPLVAWAVLGIATLFGWVVIGQMLGERLLIASGRSNPGFIFSSLVGVIVLTLLTNMPVIGHIPCLGFVLSCMGGIIGLGVSLTGLGSVLLTRFGTRAYPDSGYTFSGGSPSPRPTDSGGPRVRWVDPTPDVADEERAASEDELNARIKAALTEAEATPEPETPHLDEPKLEK